MPYRENIFVRGHYYHVYNRGVDSKNIFFSEDNYKFCLKLFRKYTSSYAVGVVAYCLMPNHYHLLLHQGSEASISRFVQVVFNAFVQALNRQRNRKGPLFEGRFKHVLISKEEYLIHLCRYIHWNPVKAGLVERPEDWEFSDYRDWIGKRQEFLEEQSFLSTHFGSPTEYKKFVMEYREEKRVEQNLQRYMLDLY